MTYKTIDGTFRQILQEAASQKRHVNLHYFTDLHEFMNVTAVVSDLLERDGEEYLQLATGEEIRLDKVTRINNEISPDHTGLYEFSCDC